MSTETGTAYPFISEMQVHHRTHHLISAARALFAASFAVVADSHCAGNRRQLNAVALPTEPTRYLFIHSCRTHAQMSSQHQKQPQSRRTDAVSPNQSHKLATAETQHSTTRDSVCCHCSVGQLSVQLQRLHLNEWQRATAPCFALCSICAHSKRSRCWTCTGTSFTSTDSSRESSGNALFCMICRL